MAPVSSTDQVAAALRAVLIKRGYETPEQIECFLNPSYETGLNDPFDLLDMESAVIRIIRAIEDQDRIVIYGDYDIDGLTATSLLLDFLSGLGAQVEGYIPDRFEEGYGLNRAALEKLQRGGARLVISVDCGITSRSEAAWAKKNGLDLIITDHHSVPDKLPEAVAVINPKRPGDPYPFKDLAGVGVAFKLAQAIQERLGRPAAGQEKWLLDLVALGTVCDVVTLVDENRVLVKFGLKVLAKTRRVGLMALAEVAGVKPEDITSYHLGFLLGPRLNAAGRLEHATKALALLTTQDKVLATTHASYLDGLNSQRRAQQAEIYAAAMAQAQTYVNDPALVLADPAWSHGIVGIVASKLVERWHKPALVLQVLGQTAKGSGRSTAQFNLVEGLRRLDGRFLKLGGHFFAAGFTIKADQIEGLRQELNQLLIERDLPPLVDPPADIQLTDFSELSLELADQLDRMEPFGTGNPKPTIAVPEVKVVRTGTVGADAKHLKLALADKVGNTMTALGFNLADQHPNLAVGQTLAIQFHLVKNDFLGQVEPELVLQRLK